MSPRRLPRTACIGLILAGGLLLAITATPGAQLSPGSLDTTFGGDGTTFAPTGLVAVPASSNIAMIQAMATDSQNRIVAAGREGEQWVVMRFLTNGVLDPAFGTGGKVYPLEPLPNAEALDVAVDTQNRVVVVGTYGFLYPTGQLLTMIRLTADGSLDSAFDNDGVVQVAIDNGARAKAVEIQADGRIVVAGGCASKQGFWSMLIVRFLDDGSLDRISFGTPTDPKLVKKGHPPFLGYLIDDFNSRESECVLKGALVLQPDGKLVVGGFDGSTARQDWPASHQQTWTLVRYLPDGRSRDTLFGAEGVVSETPPVSAWDLWYLMGLALQPVGNDYRILACGAGWESPSAYGVVVGYTANGGIDTAFGSGGLAVAGLSGWSHARQVAVDASGNVVVGLSADGSKFAFRFTASGQADGTFGPDPQWPGLSAAASLPGDSTEWCACSILDSAGGILVGGASALGVEPYTMSLSVAKFVP